MTSSPALPPSLPSPVSILHYKWPPTFTSGYYRLLLHPCHLSGLGLHTVVAGPALREEGKEEFFLTWGHSCPGLGEILNLFFFTS